MEMTNLEPAVLIRVLIIARVRAKHDDMRPRNVERVEEIRRRSALLKGHPPSGIEGSEFRAQQWQELLLVVPLGDHPRPRAGKRLYQLPERVPEVLLIVGIRQIARQEMDVVFTAVDVIQGRGSPARLAKISSYREGDRKLGGWSLQMELRALPAATVIVNCIIVEGPDDDAVDLSRFVE